MPHLSLLKQFLNGECTTTASTDIFCFPTEPSRTLKCLIRLSRLVILRLSSTACLNVQHLLVDQEIGQSFNSCRSYVPQRNSKEGRKNHASYWQIESCSANMWPNVLARPEQAVINRISVCSFFSSSTKNGRKLCLCFNVISCLDGMRF